MYCFMRIKISVVSEPAAVPSSLVEITPSEIYVPRFIESSMAFCEKVCVEREISGRVTNGGPDILFLLVF